MFCYFTEGHCPLLSCTKQVYVYCRNEREDSGLFLGGVLAHASHWFCESCDQSVLGSVWDISRMLGMLFTVKGEGVMNDSEHCLRMLEWL